MIVSPSAYLAAFPRALASEAILLLHRIRLTLARRLIISGRERWGSYSVPDQCLLLSLETSLFAGIMLDACRNPLG
jgi:hypothetical protein